VLSVTIPFLLILPNWIVKPVAESISLTPLIVGMAANCCKFNLSAPPDPSVITCAGPLNLTLLPAVLWWSTE